MENFNSNVLAFSTLLLILYFVVKVFYSVWWKPKSLEKALSQQGIKGNPYKLLYGDIKDMKRLIKESWSKPMALSHGITHRVNPFYYQTVQKYGKICVVWNNTKPRVIVKDPQLLRGILMDKNGHLEKPHSNPLAVLLTLGLSMLERGKWAKRRKLISPAFRYEKIQGMFPAFSTSCCNLVDQWKGLASSQGSCVIDVAIELENLTADIIARSAFGSSFQEGKNIFKLQIEQAALVIEAAQSLYFPGLRFIPTKKNKRRYEIDRMIKGMLSDMIKKKEDAREIGEAFGDDLLDLLLQCKDNINNEMTTDDVMEECKLFYFAAQDTTTSWLIWTIIVLSMHQNWQEKAREEIFQVCGKTKKPDFESISRLKIVSMILQEVLRLYPPVTGHYRHTYKQINIANISIPAGVEIFLPVLILHHDSEYWGDDVEEFKPERFSEGISNASSKNDKGISAFYPFGWGPRICLGQRFAELEAKLALAIILQNFSFELSPSYTHAPYTITTLRPQHGAPIILHKL